MHIKSTNINWMWFRLRRECGFWAFWKPPAIEIFLFRYTFDSAHSVPSVSFHFYSFNSLYSLNIVPVASIHPVMLLLAHCMLVRVSIELNFHLVCCLLLVFSQRVLFVLSFFYKNFFFRCSRRFAHWPASAVIAVVAVAVAAVNVVGPFNVVTVSLYLSVFIRIILYFK